MENQPQNEPKPESSTTDEIAELDRIVEERRKAEGIEKPIVGKLKYNMATLQPLSPQEEERRQKAIEEIESRERARRRRERLEKFLESVGHVHSGCRLHNFVADSEPKQKVLDALTEYSNTMQDRFDSQEGLVLYGPMGTGKDHLAVALGGIGVERHDLNVRLVNGQDWLGTVRDAMDSGTTEAALLRDLCWQDILIISDPLPPFGALGQHMATMLYRLVEQRDFRGKLTWATINVANDQDAYERLGAPTWDRLCDRAWKVRCAWPSHRKAARSI